MGFFLESFVKDLRRIRRDPAAVALAAAIPLLIAFLLMLAFGGEDDATSPRATLLVTDLDGTPAGGVLVGALGQGPLAGLIRVETVEETEGRRRIERGDASAHLIVPAGFGRALLDDEPSTLRVTTNPAQRILPRIVTETLGTFGDLVFYAQQLLGRPLREPTLGIESFRDFGDSASIALGREINDAVSGARPYLLPPLVSLEEPPADEPGPALHLGKLFLPGMLLMGLLFVAQSQSLDVWQEVDRGTLRRTATTPGGIGAWLAGKAAAVTVVMLVVGAVGMAAGRWVFGLEIARLPWAVAWTGLAGVLLFFILLALQVHAAGARAGSVLTSAVIFPLAMLGGSFFPFEIMPGFLAAIGRWTPNGWALSVLRALIDGETSSGALILPTAAVAAGTAGLFAYSLWRIRRRFLGA